MNRAPVPLARRARGARSPAVVRRCAACTARPDRRRPGPARPGPARRRDAPAADELRAAAEPDPARRRDPARCSTRRSSRSCPSRSTAIPVTEDVDEAAARADRPGAAAHRDRRSTRRSPSTSATATSSTRWSCGSARRLHRCDLPPVARLLRRGRVRRGRRRRRVAPRRRSAAGTAYVTSCVARPAHLPRLARGAGRPHLGLVDRRGPLRREADRRPAGAGVSDAPA